VNPLSNIPGAARGIALAVTLAGTISSSPRREIRASYPAPADWAADPARVGHEPGYTWNEPDGIMRCVHCGYGPCRSANGHSLSAIAASAAA
jgi:hypothetical protein